MIDTFSRYVPVLDPRHSCRGEDVVQTLERICRQAGYSKTIRVDQGTEFVSRGLDLWAYAQGMTLDFSRPGKPTDNTFIDEDWRRDYNEVRPHGAIGNKVPILLMNPLGVTSPPP